MSEPVDATRAGMAPARALARFYAWLTSACFGHAGNFGTLAWADPTTGCAIAAVTNGNRRPTALVTRFAGIGSGLRAACVA